MGVSIRAGDRNRECMRCVMWRYRDVFSENIEGMIHGMDLKGGKRLEANAEWMIQRIGIAVEFTTSGSASGSGQ